MVWFKGKIIEILKNLTHIYVKLKWLMEFATTIMWISKKLDI